MPWVLDCSVTKSYPTLCNPWIAARQPSLSFTLSLRVSLTHVHWLVMPSNHLTFCCPLLSLPSLFLNIRIFSYESALQVAKVLELQHLVLAMNSQDWFPLVLTGLIFLLLKGLLRIFSSSTVWNHQFFGSQPSWWFNFHIHKGLRKNHSFGYMNLCLQSDVSDFYYSV